MSGHKQQYRDAKQRKNKAKKDEHLRLRTQTQKKNYSRPLHDETVDDIAGRMTSLGSSKPAAKAWQLTGTWDASRPRMCPTFAPLLGKEEEIEGEMKDVVITRIQCITSMDKYKKMSFEELRLGDHMAGIRYKSFPSGGSLFKEATLKSTAKQQNWSRFGTKGIRFCPAESIDEESNTGMTDVIETKIQCITSMPEYEKKSLEELRLEDHMTGFNYINGFQHENSSFSDWFQNLPDNLVRRQNEVLTEFQPMTGSDTMMRSGAQTSIQTRHQTITAMEEYETISFEELRLKDYLSGHKGPKAQLLQASPEELKDIKIQPDMEVYVTLNKEDNEIMEKGKVKFIGRLPEKAFGKLHVGIELKKMVGDGDGFYQGVRLFRTEPYYAKIVPLKDVFPRDLLDKFQSDESDTEDEESILDSDLETKKCVICIVNPVEIYLSPCGHVCCCGECSKQVSSCPMCRQSIQQKSKAYLP